MPRHKRLDIPGAIHHVIVRGIERRNIFIEDKDRTEFLKRLENALKNTMCKCYAWALIPNHVHLLIKTGRRSLTEAMRSLLTGYAIYFNRHYRRSGYLYQNRYKSILCQEDKYLLKLIAYIHLNPLKSRIIYSLSDLEGYPWSGHAYLLGMKKNNWQPVNEVLGHFGDTLRQARENYRVFIKDNANYLMDEDFASGGLVKSLGGWKKVETLRRKKLSWRADERILGDSSFVDEVLKIAEEQIEENERLKQKGWNLCSLEKHLFELLNINNATLRQKGRANATSQAKALFCHLGYDNLSVKAVDIARFLGISQAAVSKNIIIGRKLADKIEIKLLS